METFDIVKLLGNLAPALVYLAGFIWLGRYLLFRFEQLVEKYHTLALDAVKTLGELRVVLEREGSDEAK